MKLRLVPFAAALATGLLLPALPSSAMAATNAKPAAKPRAGTAAKRPATLAPADAAQRDAAQRTYYGDYACEFAQTVKVSANAKNEGYVDLRFKQQTWVMKPVLSSTGALRLEDVKGRMLLVQIANKSMLMDTKIGQRVVDGCMNPQQRETALAS